MPELMKPPTQFFFTSDGFGIEPKVYTKSNGAKIYSGVAVFRSGTFRDSTGEQSTWEELHVKQMMDNYTHLNNKKILNAVVRDGHKSWLVSDIPGRGEVVGWHHDLVAKKLKSPIDGQEYTYLLADYELTQQYAIEKQENGTWRNRSAEVGGYRTNDESEFWPVYLGFAFVDFPAVEGLNFSSSQKSDGVKFFSLFSGNNQGVPAVSDATGAAQGGTALPFPPNMMPGAAQGQPAQHGQGQPVSGQPASGQPASTAQPFVFTVNGQQTTDYAAVQARVTQLEQFASDTRAAARKDFVAGLVSSNKVAAPQQAGLEAFALSLDDTQYGLWSETWKSATVPAILGNHSAPAVTNPNNGAQPVDQAIQNAEAIVKMHETGGVMKPDQIKKTASYQLLVQHGKRQA